MKSNHEMPRANDLREEGGAQRAWNKPAVIRLSAGAAEVGTRSTPDGPLSSTS